MNHLSRLKHNILFATVTALVFIFNLSSSAQIQVAAGYTSCPNQPATVTPVWNNVGNVTYTLVSPGGLSSPNVNSVFTPGNFTISNSSTVQTCVNFTLLGVGTSSTGAVSSSVLVQLCVIPPAALTITNVNGGVYCPGETATITAPIGGSSYNIVGSNYSLTGITSNIITLINLPASFNATFVVTSVGSCTMTGTTVIQTPPNTPLAINGVSNVCQDQLSVLSASLNNGNNFRWYDNNTNTLLYSTPSHTFAATQPSNGITYKCIADYTFATTQGSVACPRDATTSINVVQTAPVNVSAVPGFTLCQGIKLGLTANTSISALGWAWSGPSNFAASISNPNINPAMPTNSGDYTVTALFTNGIITCQKTNTFNVYVIPVTQPVISLPPSVCQGGSVNITAFAPSASSYSWTGPGHPSYTGGTLNISPVQTSHTGIFYATALFNNPPITCASTGSAQLNIVPVNSITVIPSAPVCQPSNAFLQCSAIGASSYSWVGPGGYQSPGPNATIYYPAPSASGIYTVTAFFNGVNITCPNTNTVQVTVNPILTFSLVPWQQACYNTPVSVNGPAGATSYTWTSSTGFTSNSKDINFSSVQPGNSGTYTLNVSLGPCITSGSTTIEVLTPIQYTLVPKSRTICRGDTTVLEVGATGGSQNYAFIWNPSVYLDSPTGPVKKLAPLSTVFYNVIAHDIACPNFTIGESFTVNVNQPPIPLLELERTEGCATLTMLYDSKTESGSIVTYDFGNELKFQPDSVRISLKTPGTYTLDIHTKGTNGCGGTFRFGYPIVVRPNPEPAIYWLPETPTINDDVSFHFNTTNGPLKSHYWYFMGGQRTVIDTSLKLNQDWDTSYFMSPSRRYDKIGNYPVFVVVENEFGCVDTVSRRLTVIDDFRLYIPNTFTPNDDGRNDKFGVVGSGIRLEGFSLEIIDRWGNVVFFSKDINEWWDGRVKGNVATIGVYTYKVRAVGMNGEGRKEFVGKVTVLK